MIFFLNESYPEYLVGYLKNPQLITFQLADDKLHATLNITYSHFLDDSIFASLPEDGSRGVQWVCNPIFFENLSFPFVKLIKKNNK